MVEIQPIIQAIDYIINKGQVSNKLLILKLLFFADKKMIL